MTDLGSLLRKSACEVGRVLARGEVSAIDLCEFALQSIEKYPDQSIFVTLTANRARSEARESAQRLAEGQARSVFEGVPIAYKDLFDVAGEVTSAGSTVYREAAPALRDAKIVSNAGAGGLVTIGKLNLTEFAYSGLGLNPHFGTPHNPCHQGKARVPGGSSSGAGVAVAAGLVPVAIGTDTGGSVRIPASFNGLVGYKPSEGRFSMQGVFPLSQTLDTLGPLAHRVEDCVQLDQILRGKPAKTIRPMPVEGRKFIVPQTLVLDDLDAEVAINFNTSLARLAAAGAKIEPVEMAVFSEVGRLSEEYGSIPAAEAYAYHQSLVDGDQVSLIDRRVVARILGGKGMSKTDLGHLHAERKRLRQRLGKLVGEAFILMPTTPMTAPEIAPLEADDDLFHKTNLKALRNTSLGNFLNMPGLALPNGVDHCGMPTSILISSTEGRDEELLGVGLAVEQIISGKAAGN